ncbi:MAG: hypothetical protein LBS81_05470 [Endomicrobium sp.]|jgi:hypothetical protein|nr:hypothetical protein [Endomicrobium sp.]
MSFVDKYNISASYAVHFQNSGYYSFSFTVPLYFAESSDKIGVKISYRSFDYGKIDRYVESADGDYVQNGIFTASDAVTQISFEYKFYKIYHTEEVLNTYAKT